jgi:hypothetical protein
MLSLQQKIAVRRHLGVPFAGTAEAGRLFGWRFEIHVEDLEYKMNNMQAPEEQLLTGVSLGSYRISGSPTAGDNLALTINGTTVHYVVQTSDVVATDVLGAVALNAALAVMENATLADAGDVAVGVRPSDKFSPAYLPPYFGQVIVTGPSAAPLALSSAVTGTTNLFTDNPGSQCPIVGTFLNSTTGAQTTAYGLIAVCDYLANSMMQLGSSLRLVEAMGAGGAGVKYRGDELGARRALYREYVMQLARAIGGEKYVRKFSGGGRRGSVA